MEDFIHVEGKSKGKIILYALSTCIWCKKTKNLLESYELEYDYIYVDLLEGDRKNEVINDISKMNPLLSFPTIIINDNRCISGYKEDEIKELCNE